MLFGSFFTVSESDSFANEDYYVESRCRGVTCVAFQPSGGVLITPPRA